MLNQELENIGLSEKEAKVYIAALELGKATAQEVAKKAGLKRPTTYFTMEGLMNMGLMSSVHEGKKQYFMAETPERLVDVFEAKQDELKRQGEKLNKIIPDLKKISQKDAGPVVRYYTGKEGVLSMVKDLLTVKKNEEIYMAYNADLVRSMLTQKEREGIRFDRAKKNIHVYSLYTTDGDELESSNVSKRKILDKEKYPLDADIAVYGDKIRLASLGDNAVGIVIENKDLANSLKSILRLCWDSTKSKKGTDK